MALLILICVIQFVHIALAKLRVACQYPNNTFTFCNTSLPIDQRINNLISLLSLDEKGQQLTARKSPSIARLSLPEYNWGTNCIHSVLSKCYIDESNLLYCSTNFPNVNGLGATFNKTLIYNISVAIGLELRALWIQGLDVGLDCWGPTINIGRDPRWGRMYEVPSEDAYWNGIYGTLFTLGLQNGSTDTIYHDSTYFGVISTLKHLAAYSLGGIQSFTFDAKVSDYLFQDTYFPPFIAAIQNGNAKGVMCSYNSINGIPACLHKELLNEILRQKWKFDGYIVSDSGAIAASTSGHHYTHNDMEATKLALEASVDINSGNRYKWHIENLVNDGDISEDLVNKALYNSFKVRFELGLFDGDNAINNSNYFNVPKTVIGIHNENHVELNKFAAGQTMTLLKNDNILPFNITNMNNNNLKIGIFGPHYNATKDLFNGYTGRVCNNNGTYECMTSILNAVEIYVNDSSNILYAQGCNGIFCNSTHGFNQVYNIARESDIIILMMGINGKIEKEGIDRVNISLPGYQKLLALNICKLGKPTVLVLINGGIVAIDELKYECPAILEAWNPGYYGAIAIMDTLFGINNPNGKMAVTMYWSNFTQIADWHSMDITGMDDKIYGYGRTYKYWNGPKPLYTFGWGLSYTMFKFAFYNGTECDQINTFCVRIINIGNRYGYETIFVFIIPPHSTIPSTEPASKMIKRLVEFEKIYLDVNQSYIFKWDLNKNDHFRLYDKNGIEHMFDGNFSIQFTNGVDQNLFVTINIITNNTSTHADNTKTFWSVINIFIVVIIICVLVAAFVIGLASYCRYRNQKIQKEIENALTQNMNEEDVQLKNLTNTVET